LFFKKAICSHEQQLWDGIKAGDKKSLAAVYKLHAKALYNYGNKIYHNPSLVEDSIHDVFLDLWNYRQKLSPVISIRAYLFASVRRKIIRSKESVVIGLDNKWVDFDFVVESDEKKIVDSEFHDEQVQRLKSHLNNLSPRQYEAIILRFYDKMHYRDIASIMEVNEQSARNLVQRGIEYLRQFARITVSILAPLLLVALG
jgi:RNA polymerase sigma factor (sigma-70 family)